MKFKVHLAIIPERYRELSPEARHLLGVQYLNACDERQWQPVPDALFEPWTLDPCETCKRIVASQSRRST